MIDVTQEKLRVLQNTVEKTKDFVRQFCDIRDDIYSIQRTEWLQSISEMEKIINDEAILMFIGPFSSGKSSFVNALLGEDVLPTANTPCTAVVTEISFTDGGGDTGKIFRRNEPEKAEEVDYNELKNIINGPSGASGEVASYHHVEICLDVTEKESRKQFASFIGRIRIIDCPGFGSPYFANEDIINEYIEKSSFTFWMSPCNKIGGKETETYLKNIKKNTATLIPLITKSDLIPDEDEREAIKESFYSQLSSFFKSREPHFISSFKFKEALAYEQKLQKENKPSDEKFEQLRIASGIDWVTSAMQDCATKKSSNIKKFDSVIFSTREILKELHDKAATERRYWQNKLEQLGWNTDEKKYEELDAIQDRTDRWIKEEAKKVSDAFRNELLQKLVTNEVIKVDASEITTAWQNTIDKKKNDWIAYIQNQYLDYIKDYMPYVQNDFTSLNATSFKSQLVAGFRNTFDSVLDSLRVAGPQSVITGSLGAVALASTSVVSGVWGIGGALASVLGIAGGALIAVAVLPLIPVITKGIRDRKEIDKQKKENEIRQYLNNINVAPLIEQILGKTHKEVYAYIIKNLKNELAGPKGNYDTCCNIIEGIKEELGNLNARFTK